MTGHHTVPPRTDHRNREEIKKPANHMQQDWQFSITFPVMSGCTYWQGGWRLRIGYQMGFGISPEARLLQTAYSVDNIYRRQFTLLGSRGTSAATNEYTTPQLFGHRGLLSLIVTDLNALSDYTERQVTTLRSTRGTVTPKRPVKATYLFKHLS